MYKSFICPSCKERIPTHLANEPIKNACEKGYTPYHIQATCPKCKKVTVFEVVWERVIEDIRPMITSESSVSLKW